MESPELGTYRTHQGLSLPGLSQVLMGKQFLSYPSSASSWDDTKFLWKVICFSNKYDEDM